MLERRWPRDISIVGSAVNYAPIGARLDRTPETFAQTGETFAAMPGSDAATFASIVRIGAKGLRELSCAQIVMRLDQIHLTCGAIDATFEEISEIAAVMFATFVETGAALVASSPEG